MRRRTANCSTRFVTLMHLRSQRSETKISAVSGALPGDFDQKLAEASRPQISIPDRRRTFFRRLDEGDERGVPQEYLQRALVPEWTGPPAAAER